MFTKKFICFDIGATKILKAVVKMRGDKYEILEIEEQKNPRNEEKIKNILSNFCDFAKKRYKTKKVSVSAAYIADQKNRIISQGKYCYGTDRFSFDFLEKNDFRVRFENDGRCFALGEYYFGKGKKSPSLLAMTLGTNIGGGFLLEGKNFRGAHQTAMEISYLNFLDKNVWQNWDDRCAGRGIENSYRRKTGRKLEAKDIFSEANKGDKEAKEAVSEAADILGRGIASLINILDPEQVVFGGSLSKQKKFINQAVATAQKHVFNKQARYKFSISTLGNRANLLGAVKNFTNNP